MAEPRVVRLPMANGAFQAGAVLVSYIACPGLDRQAEQNRIDAERTVGFEALKKGGGNLPQSQIQVPPHYLSQSDAERKRILRKMHTQVRNRRAAARIAMPLLWQFGLKPDVDLPGRTRSLPPAIAQKVLSFQRELAAIKGRQTAALTIDALAGRYQSDVGESEATNVQSRAFRPSYPVLHMAIALELAFTHALQMRLDSPSIYELTLRSDFLKYMLAAGTVAAKLIALTPELQGAARQLIRFEPARVG